MKKNVVRLALLVLLLCVLFTGCNPTSKFVRYVKKGEYQKAVNFYQSNLKGKVFSKIDAVSFLKDYLHGQWSKYLEGKISEDEISKVFSTLEEVNSQLGFLPEIKELNANLAIVKKSKKSFEQGKVFLKDKCYPKAIEAFQGVVAKDTENYKKAQAEIAKAVDSYESEILSLAEKMLAAKDSKGAISVVMEGECILGETDKFADFFYKIYSQQFVEQFDDFLVKNDKLSALKVYDEAKRNPYIAISPQQVAKYTEIKNECIQEVIAKAEVLFMENSDFSAAMEVLKSAQEVLGAEPELMAQQEHYEFLYEENFVEEILSEAKSAFGDGEENGCLEAMNIIKRSLSEFPNSDQLNKALEHYEQYVPINLAMFDYAEKTDYFVIGTSNLDIARDVNETLYNDSTVVYLYGRKTGLESIDQGEESNIIFYLDREYTKLTGTVYRPYQTLAFGDNWRGIAGRFEIFGDGMLLYSAIITEDTFEAEKFELDLTGVHELKIELRGAWTDFYTNWRPLAAATDLFLYRF